MIYVWVRPGVDWADEDGLRERLREDLRPGFDLWNATFGISLPRFRLRLREIARQNHATVEGAIRATWDEIPDGALVLPVDDDDWFAPEVATTLADRLPSDSNGCRWTPSWVEVPIDFGHRLHMLRHRLLGAPLKWICTTNNYGLVKAADTKPLLTSHLEASRWWEARSSEQGNLTSLNLRLSVANRTLGSISTLRRIDRRTLLRKLCAYRRLYGRELPSELAWARPHVDDMAGLMDELEPR